MNITGCCHGSQFFSPIFCHVLRRFLSRSHYDVLGVSQSATQKEIRSAFIEKSKLFHPDINKDPKNHDQFVKISEAYSTLSNTAAKRDYDNMTGIRAARSRPNPGPGPYPYPPDPRYHYTNKYSHNQFSYERYKSAKDRPESNKRGYDPVIRQLTILFSVVLFFNLYFLGRTNNSQKRRYHRGTRSENYLMAQLQFFNSLEPDIQEHLFQMSDIDREIKLDEMMRLSRLLGDRPGSLVFAESTNINGQEYGKMLDDSDKS